MSDHGVSQSDDSGTEEIQKQVQVREKETQDDDDDDEEGELRKLLLPNVRDLPLTPPSAVDSNFVAYFAPDFMKPGHDQYVYRHANGLCVIGLASTHVAFKDPGGVTAVDFNVGKSDRSGFKVTGKRKKNAQHFESNTALCKVCTDNESYIVRCCVKGSLLEVNDRLIKQPGLLNSSVDKVVQLNSHQLRRIQKQIEKDTLRSSCQNRQIGSRSRVRYWALKTTGEKEKNANYLKLLPQLFVH